MAPDANTGAYLRVDREIGGVYGESSVSCHAENTIVSCYRCWVLVSVTRRSHCQCQASTISTSRRQCERWFAESPSGTCRARPAQRERPRISAKTCRLNSQCRRPAVGNTDKSWCDAERKVPDRVGYLYWVVQICIRAGYRDRVRPYRA